MWNLDLLVYKHRPTHSSTLAWKIPWTEEPGRLQSMGSLESDRTEWLHFHFSLSCIGEGNGNPLQCSCLENPRDGEAWWAAVCGVTQSQTRLKQLSSSSSKHRPKKDFKCSSYLPLPTSYNWKLFYVHWVFNIFFPLAEKKLKVGLKSRHINL